MLSVNESGARILSYSVKAMGTAKERAHCTVTNYRDKIIFLIGGKGDTQSSQQEKLDSVTAYYVEEKIMTQWPSLNVARSHASSCTTGDSVFVFGGENKTSQSCSIERLHGVNRGKTRAHWELIELPNAVK